MLAFMNNIFLYKELKNIKVLEKAINCAENYLITYFVLILNMFNITMKLIN